MRYIILIFCCYIFFNTKMYAQVSTQWVSKHTDPEDDIAKAMKVDKFGNVYVTGSSVSSTEDYLTIKYNTNGNQRWSREYNSGHSDIARAIDIDNLGNVYVTGSSGNTGSQNIITIKYDSLGNTKWIGYFSRAYDDIGYAIKVDRDYNVYVTGSSKGNSVAEDDYILIKYDSYGHELWWRYYDNALGTDKALAIDLDTSQKHIYITGGAWDGSIAEENYVTIKYDANGNQIWTREYDNAFGADIAKAIKVDDKENIYITGGAWDGSIAQENYVTIKYDADGNQKWLKEYDNSFGPDIANDLDVDAAGNIYTTGGSWDGSIAKENYVTIKYDADGNQKWLREYDNSFGPDIANDLAIDKFGNVYVTGSSWNGSIAKEDYTTIKYDSAGNKLWGIEYSNGHGSDYSNAIGLDTAGNVYVTGQVDGGISNKDFATIKYCTPPAVTVAADTVSVCPGDSAQLEVFGGASYSWYTTTGISNPSISNPKVLPISSGYYYVYVKNLNGCGKYAGIYVKIKPKPVIKVNTPVICAGQTAILTATGAASYVWSNNLGTSAAVTTATLNNTTIFSVTGTLNGCSASKTAIVKVDTVPPPYFFLGNDTTYCGFFTRTLSTGISSTAWNTGDTASSIFIFYPGRYIAIIKNACGISSDTIVIVNYPVMETPTITQSHDTLFSNVIISGASYEWYKGGVLQTTTSTPYYKFPSSGIYTLKVISNDCPSAISANFNAILTGIKNNKLNVELSIIPNPNNGSFEIRITSGMNKTYQLKLFNLSGQVLVDEEMNIRTGMNSKRVNLIGIEKGAYFLNIIGEDGIATQNIIVQ